MDRLPTHLLAQEYFSLNDNPTTLHWLISGYVLRLEPHVRQIMHGD